MCIRDRSIVISGNDSLSDDEIQSMIDSANKHMDEDNARRELVEARNRFESLIYSAEKSVSDGVYDEGTSSNISSAIESAKNSVNFDSLESINSSISSVESVIHSSASSLYSDSVNNESEDDSVIDVDYE